MTNWEIVDYDNMMNTHYLSVYYKINSVDYIFYFKYILKYHKQYD